MKKWRYGFHKIALWALTAILACGTANSMSLCARAKGLAGKDIALYGGTGEENLTGDEKKIYDQLRFAAQQVASGQRASTTVAMSDFAELQNSKEEMGATMDRVLSYLLMDCPYDFYWYDKKTGYSCTWTATDQGEVLFVTVSLQVANGYQGTADYTVDMDKTKAAKLVAEKAQTIVNRHRSEPDYDKLKSYMTEICNLASYNWDVYNDNMVPYGDPWQPVWVFDGDPDTSVVCEGYAKAFQYLCDLSTFQNAVCYTVEGDMSGGTGSGSHMWNVVTLEGRNYLVDVTNCDSGSVGEPDQLFLAGAEGSVENGYTVFVGSNGTDIVYYYGDNQFGLLGNVLELSPYSYQDPDMLKLKITAPEAGEVAFGDPVDDQVLTGGLAVNGKNEEVPGSFAWRNDVTSYGNVGTNTLQAVFTPANPQYQPVENISVPVKVQRRPVTVTAEEKSKIYGDPDPELTYAYTNVIEGYPLSGELMRTSGEDVGTYPIQQGTLTDDNNPNYTITFTGSNLRIIPASNKPIEFVVGNAKADVSNGVTLKSAPVYGDLWSDIVKIGSITARTGAGSDSNQGHFTLQESGMPGVGAGQMFHVVYNGTIGGQTYRNEIVCEGTVDVKKRVLTVSPGSYKVSKAYDKTRSGGNAAGQLSLDNLLAADVNRIQVSATPTGYSSPDVSGQNRMTVNLTLGGAAANSYELASNTVEVPCEITPKTITPMVKVSGSYAYTGRGIAPTLTVADGTDVLAASDYEVVLNNNKNAGTAKVFVRPKRGGNYTWNPAVETTFTIEKSDYKGTKTGSTSMEYGGTAIFSMYSMLSEGYKLGEIRVSDPDKILAEAPAISGTVMSCKMSSDQSKEGKSAVITLPVTESTNYHAYDLTFTVTMAAQRSWAGNNNPTTTNGGGGGTEKPTPAPSNPTTDIQDGQPPASDNTDIAAPGGASVTAVDREKTKASHSKGFPVGPIVWGLAGAALTGAIVGTVYFIRRKKKVK